MSIAHIDTEKLHAQFEALVHWELKYVGGRPDLERKPDGNYKSPITSRNFHYFRLGAITAQADLSQAARDVLTERSRQVDSEGHTTERDDGHNASELAYAAAWYATPPCARHVLDANDMGLWPITWPSDSFKAGDRRRELVKSSALAMAEVERMDRAKAKNGGAA